MVHTAPFNMGYFWRTAVTFYPGMGFKYKSQFIHQLILKLLTTVLLNTVPEKRDTATMVRINPNTVGSVTNKINDMVNNTITTSYQFHCISSRG